MSTAPRSEKAHQIASGPDRMSGGPFQFQHEHLVIPHPPCAARGHLDRRIDRCDDAERSAPECLRSEESRSSSTIFSLDPCAGVKRTWNRGCWSSRPTSNQPCPKREEAIHPSPSRQRHQLRSPEIRDHPSCFGTSDRCDVPSDHARDRLARQFVFRGSGVLRGSGDGTGGAADGRLFGGLGFEDGNLRAAPTREQPLGRRNPREHPHGGLVGQARTRQYRPV